MILGKRPKNKILNQGNMCRFYIEPKKKAREKDIFTTGRVYKFYTETRKKARNKILIPDSAQILLGRMSGSKIF